MERALVDEGIQLIKYWFEVSMAEQEARFRERIDDRRKTWKLSPMDIASYQRWYDYSRARDAMLLARDTEHAPWYLVDSDDKRRARLNCVTHLLNLIPYREVPRDKVRLGKRRLKDAYDDRAARRGRRLVAEGF